MNECIMFIRFTAAAAIWWLFSVSLVYKTSENKIVFCSTNNPKRKNIQFMIIWFLVFLVKNWLEWFIDYQSSCWLINEWSNEALMESVMYLMNHTDTKIILKLCYDHKSIRSLIWNALTFLSSCHSMCKRTETCVYMCIYVYVRVSVKRWMCVFGCLDSSKHNLQVIKKEAIFKSRSVSVSSVLRCISHYITLHFKDCKVINQQ